jgi:hypothetical protein
MRGRVHPDHDARHRLGVTFGTAHRDGKVDWALPDRETEEVTVAMLLEVFVSADRCAARFLPVLLPGSHQGPASGLPRLQAAVEVGDIGIAQLP